jgi:hypothetical protein
MRTETPITTRGVRGFLQWYKRENPGIYAKAAPQIAALAPRAFTNYNAGLSGLAVLADSTDTSLQPITVDQGNVSLPSVDVSSAADTGSTDAGTTGIIGDIINGISQGYMTYTQAQAQQQVLNTQLARAQAGLPPLNYSLSSSGVPTISTASSVSSWLLPAGLALGAIALFSGSRGRRR